MKFNKELSAHCKIDGKTDDGRKSARCDLVDDRTGKKYGKWGSIPKNAVVRKVPRVSKFRFIYPMYRKNF